MDTATNTTTATEMADDAASTSPLITATTATTDPMLDSATLSRTPPPSDPPPPPHHHNQQGAGSVRDSRFSNALAPPTAQGEENEEEQDKKGTEEVAMIERMDPEITFAAADAFSAPMANPPPEPTEDKETRNVSQTLAAVLPPPMNSSTNGRSRPTTPPGGALRDPNIGCSKKIRHRMRPSTSTESSPVIVSNDGSSQQPNRSSVSMINTSLLADAPTTTNRGTTATTTTTTTTGNAAVHQRNGLSKKTPRARAATGATTVPQTPVPLPVYRGLRQRTANKLRSKENGNCSDNSNRNERTDHDNSIAAEVAGDTTATHGNNAFLGIGQIDNSVAAINDDPEDPRRSVVVVPVLATPPHDPSESTAMLGRTTFSLEQSTSGRGTQGVVSNTGLVVAREVQGESNAGLMQAEEIDPEELARKAAERKKKKKNKQCIFVGNVLILIFLAFLLLVIFSQSKKGAVELPTVAPSSLAPSNSPSFAPSGALDLLLQEGLPEYTLASLERFGTPQWRAWEWLENHPDLLGMEESRKIQLFALVTFYYSMDGDNWPQAIQSNWLQYDVHECFWFSSEYGKFSRTGWEEWTLFNRTPCTEESNSREYQLLVLSDLNLLGNIPILPPEISLLSSLYILGLPFNNINASLADFLPSQIYRMTNLRSLNLGQSLNAGGLFGPLPSDIGLLTSLTDIWLQSNSLTGWIPSQMGGSLDKLVALRMGNNALSGPLPSELGLRTSMIVLDLSSNNLHGPLPSELGLMTSITDLFLYRNNLTGSIPSELGTMTNLFRMDIDANTLSGSIPSHLGGLSKMDGNLRLSFNALTGLLPTELGMMVNLTHLYLFSNSLTGWIPTEVGRMTKMLALPLFGNSLTGQIPSQLGSVVNMTHLYLHANSLSGQIPSQLALLSNMKQLRLNNNDLTGAIPPELQSLRLNGSITALVLSNNSLSGTIPEGLCSLGVLDRDLGLGLSFDCNERLCGCCWCPCPGSNYSGECEIRPFVPSRDDKEWPGLFPTPVNRSNIITANIRTNEFPTVYAVEWSLFDEELETWTRLDFITWSPKDASSLHSYTYEVDSNQLYRLHLFDQFGYGVSMCCMEGFGWFAITSPIPTSGFEKGTVIWDASGDALQYSLEIFIWVDHNGQAHHVEYLPGVGYTLMLGGDSSTASSIVVLPDFAANSSSLASGGHR